MSFNRKIQKQEKDRIVYEQFIAGALLKFESLDNVDFSLLVEDFQAKTNTEIGGLSWHYPNHLGKYIETLESGTLKLRDGVSLDNFIKEENRTLKDKLLKVAGNTVNNYFSSLGIETFKQEKEKALFENKDKVLRTANILLISDIQGDYDELVKYGFKNIDYFKSIIRADQYFAKHPKELKKYHIILKGNQNVQLCCFDGNVELDRKLDELREKNHILKSTLRRYDYSDHIELQTYLIDNINNRDFTANERTYADIFDRIIENTLINHTLEKVGLKDKKFVPIQDYINPNRLPLPTKKSDLRILYLDSMSACEYSDRIANELGLNIDFKEDDNCGLGRYVKSNLGKYDIIIVTRIYSGNILSMNHESTEQCKDTGRELTLLVAQDDTCWDVDSELAYRIELGYVFGGNYAPNYEYHGKKIRILRQPIEVKAKDEFWIKYEQSQYSNMKGIIEASVNFYNQVLIQMGKPAISDLDFKTAEELDQDYVNAFENKIAIRKAQLDPIIAFDNMRWAVSSYLNNLKNGLISQEPEGLRITEGKDGIKVENIYKGRTMCTIIFPKKYKQDNLRIFDIQTISKKGNLSSPQTIGLYTSEFEKLKNVPNRPNEIQANALSSIQKKINYYLKPLNDEAWNKKCELEEQKRIVSQKKKSRKK